MNLDRMLDLVRNKDNFLSVNDYLEFAKHYLEFISNDKLQAVIVSKNENNYHFFQYKRDGDFNVTRPINSNLFCSDVEFDQESEKFLKILKHIHQKDYDTEANRLLVNRVIYTAQQSIGCCLDALPSGMSNKARKINGDLFERFIRLIIEFCCIDVKETTIKVPITVDGEVLFNMKYQHDLILLKDRVVKAIGSVKTTSKDRLDKVFVDKFLYNSLTKEDTPHFAIFLNDVQRKGQEGKYGISSTFLPGHFKGYTVKLNPLDGVYYCDIRPNMLTEKILSDHIKTFDCFIFSDMWKFVE